jgi:GNAT superfamily N-acetyltransferase
MQGHAVDSADPPEAYREMYAAASPPWVEQGYFEHCINVPATDGVALDAFASLSFGQMLVFGVRGTDEAAGQAPEVRITRAGPEDVDVVGGLLFGLSRFNSLPPLYRPYVPNPGPGWAGREGVLKQIEAEDCCFWLAYESDEAVGLVVLTPPEPSERMISGDKTVYLWIGYVKPAYRSGGIGKALVERGLAWARERGFEHCTVGWFSPNITGARFWTRRGYRPAMRRLERRLDPRIAWARAQDG